MLTLTINRSHLDREHLAQVIEAACAEYYTRPPANRPEGYKVWEYIADAVIGHISEGVVTE